MYSCTCSQFQIGSFVDADQRVPLHLFSSIGSRSLLMLFTPNDPPSGARYDPIARAREYVLVIIDTEEVRSQRIACLLTLAGMRAIVVPTSYQAFDRFLHERFVPQAILVGQREELSSNLFSRFYQRLRQEFRRETPVMPLTNVHLLDGNLLVADEKLSPTIHQVAALNNEFLQKIWQIIPAAQISPGYTKNALVLNSLVKRGFKPRVAHSNRSSSLHFWEQLTAAKKIIPAEMWETLLTDVGLAQFCKEENRPAKSDQRTIPPEYFSCLTRAVFFSNPAQPAKQAHDWAMLVDEEFTQKASLIFVYQQVSKLLGQDRTLRIMLNTFVSEINLIRGEDLFEYKRLDDGSFVAAIYSNMFIYGIMGATQPACYIWLAAFEKGLELLNLQTRWKVRELECSGVTHTGHCVFQLAREAS
jgi:hypothetical protein